MAAGVQAVAGGEAGGAALVVLAGGDLTGGAGHHAGFQEPVDHAAAVETRSPRRAEATP